MIRFCAVHKSINFHNKLLITIIISFLSIICAVSTIRISSEAYLERIRLSKTQTYGAFTDIIYQNDVGNESDEAKSFAGIGYINACLLDAADNQVLIIGTIDQEAQALSFPGQESLNLSQLKNDACVLTQSVSNDYFNGAVEGSVINFQNRQYVVEAVIDDYGYLWTRGEAETKANMFPPGLIVSKQAFREIISDESRPVTRIILFDGNVLSDSMLTNIDGKRYPNHNIYMQKEEGLYGLPKSFAIVTMIVIVLLVVTLLYMYSERSSKKYTILVSLGLTGRNYTQTRLYDFACIWGISLFAGFLLSYFTSALMLSLIEKTIALPALIIFVKNIIYISTVYSLSFLLFFLFANLEVGDASSKKKPRKNNFSLKTRLPQESKFVITNTRRRVYQIGLLVVLGVLTSALVAYIYSYYDSKDSPVTTSDHLTGKMLQKADYQMVKIPSYAPQGKAFFDGEYHDNSQENIALIASYDENKNELDRMINELLEIDGVAHINGYIENYSMYTEVSKELSKSAYLQTLYAHEIKTNQDAFWGNKLDLSSTDIISSEIIGVSDDELLALAETFAVENIDSLIRGEEALLVAPSYVFSQQETENPDGSFAYSTYWEKVPPYYPNAVSDTFTSAGDPLTLYFLEASQTAYGVFNLDQAVRLFDIKPVQTRISGISYDNIGWFGTYGIAPPRAYRYLVSKAFFEHNNLSDSVTRVGVFLRSDANYIETNRQIRSIASRYGNLALYDASEELRSYHASQIIQAGYKSILVVLFLILSYAITGSIIQSIYQIERKRFAIYLNLGMRSKGLFQINFVPFTLIYSLAISIVILTYFFYLKASNMSIGPLDYLNDIATSIVFATAFWFVFTLKLIWHNINFVSRSKSDEV